MKSAISLLYEEKFKYYIHYTFEWFFEIAHSENDVQHFLPLVDQAISMQIPIFTKKFIWNLKIDEITFQAERNFIGNCVVAQTC